MESTLQAVHSRLHCPPGLSDGESATRSRERRRVAVVCRELSAQLIAEVWEQVDIVRKDIDAKLAAQLSMILGAVSSIVNLLSLTEN